MSRYDAMEESFDEVTIFNKPALFLSIRIDRKTVPQGYYLYELRHDDDCRGDAVQIARSIMVNHWGSLITRDAIKLPPDGYLDMEPDSLNYSTGECRSMTEFMEKYPARMCKLGTEQRRITRVSISIAPEDSEGADIIKFYSNLADIWGLDPDETYFDCTKINVSKNIQDNIFATLDRGTKDPCITGMMWCLRGPKAFDELPDNTVEILDGFFQSANEMLLPMKVQPIKAAAA